MKTPTILILATAAVMLGQQNVPSPPPPVDIAGFDDGAGVDEPGRPVARLSVASGDVSVRRGDDGNEWVAAALNAPLMEGDSLSVARQAAAEVQFDNAHFARMAGDTEMRITSLDGEHRIQLGRGLVTWRVLRDSQAGAEISTPAAAIRPLGMAAVRVEVAPDTTTRVTVRHGEVEVQTPRGVEQVREGGMLVVRPGGESQMMAAAPLDRWDTWSDQRDGYLMRAASPRYVSQDIYGTEDLDPYGRWDRDPQYGDVWMPSVPAGWAPYRDGRWVWEDYYGWTWIDNQPWGWAPFHYGTWYMRSGFGWAWYPGARTARYWWRPAMVGFFGYGNGVSIGIGFGNVGWVPLAPYERYRPWYGRGWNGGRNVYVTNVNITNVYRNTRFGNGATAVAAGDFQRGNYRNRFAVDAGHLQQAALVRGAGFAPTQDHLRFSDRNPAGGGPRSDFGSRNFFSRGGAQAGNSGAGRVPFREQQSQVRSALEGARQNGGAGRQFGGNVNNGGGFRNRDFGVQQPQVRPETRPEGEQSWQRFGRPAQGWRREAPPQQQAQPGAPSGEARQDSFRGQRFGGSQGQMDVSQPLIRQREFAPQQPAGQQPQQQQQAQPRYERYFGSPNPGYRMERPQPQQAPAPRQAPQREFRSAPERGGGGGNPGGGFRGNGGGGNSGGGGAPRGNAGQGGHRGR